MDFSATVTTVRPDAQAIANMPSMSIAEVLAFALGYTSDQFAALKITQYGSSAEYDAHIAKQVADSDVKNCPKWNEMHELAVDLTDTNLETTILDEISSQLQDSLGLIRAYIRQFQINEIGPTDDLVFYAFDDQTQQPSYNLYQLFLVNEISRAVEEQRRIFSGIGGSSFMGVILTNLKENRKKHLIPNFFDLVSNLKLGLAVVAKTNLQEWDGQIWVSDNGE